MHHVSISAIAKDAKYWVNNLPALLKPLALLILPFIVRGEYLHDIPKSVSLKFVRSMRRRVVFAEVILGGKPLRNTELSFSILAWDVPLSERGIVKLDGAFWLDCRDLAHHPAQRDVGQRGDRPAIDVLHVSPANICGIKEVSRERFACDHRSNYGPPSPKRRTRSNEIHT